MILIYAGDARQAEFLARHILHLPREAYRIVDGPNRLRGMRGASMLRFGSWAKRMDRFEVTDVAKLCDINIYDITDQR